MMCRDRAPSPQSSLVHLHLPPHRLFLFHALADKLTLDQPRKACACVETKWHSAFTCLTLLQPNEVAQHSLQTIAIAAKACQ